MPKLSIIIPVYNVEKYIGKCLESVFGQKVQEDLFEVIIVNDGTPDNSMAVVEKYRNCSNIKIINQENRGLSAARNRGIQESQGEYVWFIDSDDYISDDSISIILDLINKEKSDVYTFCHRKVYEKDGSLGPEIKGIANGYMSIDDFSKTPLCVSCAQFYVLKRDFFIKNDLYFHEGVFHEDLEFIAKMKMICKSIYVCTSTLYYYLVRTTGSISTTVNIKRSYDSLLIVDELENFKNNRAKSLKKKMEVNRSIAFIIIHSLLLLLDSYDTDNKEVDSFLEVASSKISIRKCGHLLFHYKFSPYLIVCLICIFVSPRFFLYLYSLVKSR